MGSWDDLKTECLACQACSLCNTRTNVVFGTGNENAEILFVGEGPGEQEDLQGEPFVGRAGKLLDSMLEIIGLNRRENIYIANIVKCRPPKNRDPLPNEQESCFPWLEKQITIMKPKILVCLGRISAMRFISDKFKISKEHGNWFKYRDIDTIALYHPAALLRDQSRRPDTFVDLKNLQKHIRNTCHYTNV